MRHRLFALSALLLLASGCTTIYYAAMERLGWAKRDILMERVQSARDSQERARNEFRDALQEFRAVVQVDGGDLEEKYETVRDAYTDAAERAEDVRARVDAVENVGAALFREWSGEIAEMKDARLRTRSQQLYDDSRERFDRLLAAMRRAEASMTPVLETLRDQMLFLKHNLNAQAVSAMRGTLSGIETDVARLLRDLDQSIGLAEQFIRELDRE